ncbi:hypothetical protein AM391_RS02995 [Kluyvera ascorbata]|nr:hypothetical protein [Kluyvera ascorbata]
MAKFSTIQELMGADMEQGGSLMKRYWNQSALPAREKRLNMPKLCIFRRDRVLRRLMNNEMNALASRIAVWSNSDA